LRPSNGGILTSTRRAHLWGVEFAKGMKHNRTSSLDRSQRTTKQKMMGKEKNKKTKGPVTGGTKITIGCHKMQHRTVEHPKDEVLITWDASKKLFMSGDSKEAVRGQKAPEKKPLTIFWLGRIQRKNRASIKERVEWQRG